MKRFQAILFDFNGTLIDIWTDENREEIYRTIANLLCSCGIPVSPEEFRTLFYDLMKEQRKSRNAEHPEFDVVEIFRTILKERGTAQTRSFREEILEQLPQFLSLTFRASSMLRLAEYPGVHDVLDQLQKKYTLAAVSDGQKIWAETELQRLDLTKYFPTRIISSDFGIRKPSPELFQFALQKIGCRPQDAIYVGNDMYRDVPTPKQLGMKTVYFKSNQGDQRYHGSDPDYIIYRFEELPTAVHFLEEHTQPSDPESEDERSIQ